MHWEEYRIAFRPDGRLRDIYILNTDLTDWQKLTELLRHGSNVLTFELDREIAPLPDEVASIFAYEHEEETLLSVDIAGMRLNCHFFIEQEIEFDLDPRKVVSEEQLLKLLEFMKEMGRQLQKDVILTQENRQDIVIFRYSSLYDRVEWGNPALDS